MMQSDITTPIEPIIANILSSSQGGGVVGEGSEPKLKEKWGDRADEPETDPIPSLKPALKKSWAAVARGNRDPNMGLQLRYVPPGEKDMADITEYDIEEGRAVWKNAVVGYILGERPSFKDVVGFVHRSWGCIQIPRVHFLKPGVFLFNFNSEEAKKEVSARVWYFNKSLIVLKQWTPKFRVEECNPEVVLVWVQFPDLIYSF